MFCSNCGKEVSENAVVCPNCGVQLAPFNNLPVNPTCPLAIVGFVLAFVFPIAGLICSIIARKKCFEERLEGGVFALAGIIISAVEIAICVIAVISVIALTSCIVANAPYYYY